jgi:hypothetical protein
LDNCRSIPCKALGHKGNLALCALVRAFTAANFPKSGLLPEISFVPA